MAAVTAAIRELDPGSPGDVAAARALFEEYAASLDVDLAFQGFADELAALPEGYLPPAGMLLLAELDGAPVGSVFVVRKTDAVAKLRLLIVDPRARGLGLGKRLVDECLRFAKEAGYSSMTLWTQSILTSARGIYQHAGFKLVAEEPHHSFGVDLVGETWERDL